MGHQLQHRCNKAESMTWAKHGSASVHFTIRQGLICHWHLTRLPQLLHHAWAKSINLSYCVWIWGVVGSSSYLKRKKKTREVNSYMWKICVIQETRKTKHNLVSLHPVSERIWTARPTLDLLLPSLMWPCVFQAAQTLSCNTYHPNYPMVADYAILLGSWSSGLN